MRIATDKIDLGNLQNTENIAAYKPRHPELTPLYKTFQHYLETYLVETQWDDHRIPDHIEAYFRKYLKCGIYAYGVARIHSDCGHDHFVPYSCKSKACPSCNSRRMVEAAAHCIDHVFPAVPVRQWVLSLPKRLRYFVNRDNQVAGKVLHIFIDVLTQTYRRILGLGENARIGGIAFPQRFGDSINVHLHYHLALIDGMFVLELDGELQFYPIPELTETDISNVINAVRKRVIRYFVYRGFFEKFDAMQMLEWNHDGGFSIDASVLIADSDREGLEKLLRYCDRPPFAMSRLHETSGNDDTLAYQLKKPLPDGTTVILLNPLELIDRIAKLMPAPYTHRHRYFGVLAPNSPFRAQVIAMVGQRPADVSALPQNEKSSKDSKGDNNQESTGDSADDVEQKNTQDSKTHNDKTDDDNQKPADGKKPKRPLSCYLWADLLARLFGVNLACPKCGKPMRVIAFIQSNESLHKILSHVGLPTEPPVISPARGPPEWDEFIDQTSCFDHSEPQLEPEYDVDQTISW